MIEKRYSLAFLEGGEVKGLVKGMGEVKSRGGEVNSASKRLGSRGGERGAEEREGKER